MTRRFEPTVQLDSGLIFPSGAGVGKVLTSDAGGNATWQTATAPGAFAATIGDGASTSIAVTHNLNSRDVVVDVRQAGAPYSAVDVDWQATDANTVTLLFASAPATNSLRVTAMSGPTLGATGYTDSLRSGVLGAADCALTINSSTSVTTAAGTVFTPGTPLVRSAIGATTLSGIPAAANARLDQIVASAAGVISRLAGTDTAGNTLTNRTGAATVPSDSQLLHDVLVTASGVLAANVRDRRPWARGFYNLITRNANAGGGSDYSSTATAWALIDGTNLSLRCELSGKPIEIVLAGSFSSTVGCQIAPMINGATPPATLPMYDTFAGSITTARTWQWVPPSAGSYLIQPAWQTWAGASGTMNLLARTNIAALFWVRELIVANANNGTA